MCPHLKSKNITSIISFQLVTGKCYTEEVIFIKWHKNVALCLTFYMEKSSPLFLSMWSLWHLTWHLLQGRRWRKTCWEALKVSAVMEVVECRNELMAFVVLKTCFSACCTGSTSKSFLHSPSFAYSIYIQKCKQKIKKKSPDLHKQVSNV